MSLTEHGTMVPAAGVSRISLAQPEARYFDVGWVGKDQVEEYARRKRTTVPDVEKWLASSLAYAR